MFLKFFTPTRVAFIILCSVSSYFLTFRFIGGHSSALIGLLIGVLIAIIIIISAESHQKDVSVKHVIGGVIGLFLGLFTASLIHSAFFKSCLWLLWAYPWL